MREEEQNVLQILGAITQLPPAEAEACKELAEHFRQQIKKAGGAVGILALTLVGAELQLQFAKE